jgi:hypothetical protein
MQIKEIDMARIKLWAGEYKYVISALGIVVVLVINIAVAAYVIGKVTGTIDDSHLWQKEQTEINKGIIDNMNKLSGQVNLQTNQIARITEWIDDVQYEHFALMKKNGLLPHKWQDVKNRQAQ